MTTDLTVVDNNDLSAVDFSDPTGLTTPDHGSWSQNTAESVKRTQRIVVGPTWLNPCSDQFAGGAKGDNATDDTAAFVAWAAALNIAGGHGYIPPKRTFLIDPDQVSFTHDDILVQGGGWSAIVKARSAGSYLFDARNSSTGLQSCKFKDFMFDGNNLGASMVMLAVNQKTGGFVGINEAWGLKMKRYTGGAYDVGQNNVEGGLNIYGGYISGSLLANGAATTQFGVNFRTASNAIYGGEISTHRLAGVTAAQGCTIRPRHIFASADIASGAPYPTCIFLTGGGLYDIGGQLDNAFQNALIVIRPSSNPIDRVTITGVETILAVQQRDGAGNLVGATYPMILCDDSGAAIREIAIVGVTGHAHTSSHWTHLVKWSGATAATSVVDDCIINACDAFWDNAPPDPGVNQITDAANGGTVSRSASLATPALPNYSNYVTGADVTMTNANQFYDGPAITIPAGTYLVTGALVLAPGSTGTATGKLWDGTTAYSSGETQTTAGGQARTMPFSAVITLGSTTTLKLSAAATSTAWAIKRTPVQNNTGLTNTASYLNAVRIA